MQNTEDIAISPEYLALSRFISQNASEELNKTILSSKKSGILCQLIINFIQKRINNKDIAKILTSSVSLLVKRPELKDVCALYSQNLAKMIGLPEGSGEKEIIAEITQLRLKNESNVALKIDFVNLRTEVERLQREIAQVSAQSTIKDETIKKLNDKLQDYYSPEKMKKLLAQSKKQIEIRNDKIIKSDESIKQLTSENNKLQEKISLLQNQIENNPHINEYQRLLKNKEDEKQHIIGIFDEMREQIESQSEELNHCITIRNNMVSYIHKLNDLSQNTLSLLDNTRQELKSVKEAKETLEKQLTQHAIDYKHIINKVISLSPSTIKKDIQDILNGKTSSAIEESFAKITEYYKQNFIEQQNTSEKEIIAKLRNVVASNISFIHQLIDSKLIQSWSEVPYSLDSIRQLLQTEIQQIKESIQKNNIQLPTVETIYNTFLFEMPSAEQITEISNYFEKFEETNSPKELELLGIVIQCIQSNFALVQYSNLNKSKVEKYSNEIKSLQNNIEAMNESAKAIKSDERARYEAEISQLKKELEEMSNQNNEETDSEEQNVNNSDIIEFATRDLNNQNQELQNCVEELKRMVDEAKADSTTKMQEIESKNNENEQQLKQQISELQDKIIELNSEIQKMKDENDILEDSIKNYGTQEQELGKCRDQISRLKEENESLERSILDLKEAAEITVKSVVSRSKKSIARVREEMAGKETEYQEKNEDLCQQIETIQAELNEKNAKIKELEDNAEQLSLHIKEIEGEKQNISAQNTVLRTQLKQCYDKMQREIASFQSELKARSFALECEYKSRMDKQKATMQSDYDSLHDIAAKLLNDPSNNHEDFIEQLDLKVFELLSLQSKLDNMKEEINQAREIISAPKSLSFIESVTSMQKTMQEKTTKLEKCEEKIRSMKKEVIMARANANQAYENCEWAEWAKRICENVTDGAYTSNDQNELRSKVESMVRECAGLGSLVKHIESLRLQKIFTLKKYNQIKPAELSAKTIICTALALRRIMKNSKFNISFKKATPEQEKSPFFDNFIVC
ncbi:hypothetical protein TVAG_450670 [Trichomonas vaginalis G3]|uniref:Uncharacterized protein n=1 Tax=Trichomonas vaginalis (strain ATCC PRA-98 / G3) TaxID=412133 RepID=A2EV44_TRIV3|nr:hypothetical protein TVAGG3_0946350 [Trichomonas vaginalis G3]EAY03494.1 hypothetical protein TVAG_450670 [Trichomonas vaginalis G3]KAI5486903.1 hypothetical protein TVAGG3_0946350 [Trichomonas vaginalis G3]|eukprot:XP_001315717.1 hypothetical protein [Trichomonas vaginalis G3]